MAASGTIGTAQMVAFQAVGGSFDLHIARLLTNHPGTIGAAQMVAFPGEVASGTIGTAQTVAFPRDYSLQNPRPSAGYRSGGSQHHTAGAPGDSSPI